MWRVTVFLWNSFEDVEIVFFAMYCSLLKWGIMVIIRWHVGESAKLTSFPPDEADVW